MEPPPPASRTLRWFLLAVGGALLALLVGSGLVAFHYLGELHTQEIAVTRALADRTQMLSGLWLSIQNYNQAVLQFVAQTRADREEAEKQRIERLRLEIETELQRYPVSRDLQEALLLQGMRGIFAQQRTMYVTILAAKPDQRKRRAEALLAAQVVPAQQEIIDWSSKLRAWNGERLQHADRMLAAQFGDVQQGLTQALAIASGSGLLLVLGGMIYIIRLERQTRARYVELARSRHQLQQLSARLVDAQETERRSISRELHDEIGQSLGALLVDIGRLSAAQNSAEPAVKEHIDHMKGIAERSLQAVRNIALLLRPSMLDDLGLAAALEWLGRETSRTSEIEVDVESENVPDDLPDEYRICIYRVAQEALHNAVRHSGARNARIAIHCPAHAIAIEVSDDGQGFDPSRTRGLGLLGMEERVKRLGGTLRVESQPGKGTRIFAELPLHAREKAA